MGLKELDGIILIKLLFPANYLMNWIRIASDMKLVFDFLESLQVTAVFGKTQGSMERTEALGYRSGLNF